MARINLTPLKARSAQTPLGNVRTDGFALSAPGRVMQDVGRSLAQIGDAAAAFATRDDDADTVRSLSEFDFEAGYIKRREEALRTDALEGFHDRTVADYDTAVSEHVGGIKNPRVKSAVEARLLSLRTGFLANAASAEEGALTRESDNLRQTKVAESVAAFDYNVRFLDLATGLTDEDAGSFSKQVQADYTAQVDAHVAGIKDPFIRESVRRQLLGRAGTYTRAAAEAGLANARVFKDAALNNALSIAQNKVRGDASNYGTSLSEGYAVIDGLDRSASEKLALKEKFRHGLARGYFDDKISDAVTAPDFEAIEEELNSDRWIAELDPKDHDALLDQTRVARAGGRTGLLAETRAMLEAGKARIDRGMPLEPAALRALEESARATGNSAVMMDVAEMIVRSNTYERFGTAPAPVLAQEIARREAADSLGIGRGRAGLPPEVREAIPPGGVLGASASFLTGLAFFEFASEMRPLAGATDFTTKTRNGTTTAMGLFQFTEDTFMNVIMGNLSHFPEIKELDRDIILELRGDPGVSTRAAALYRSANRNALVRRLGREPSETELVLAHFLGPGGAQALIAGLEADPKAPADGVLGLSTAIKNNPGIFRNKAGGIRTLQQVMDQVVERSIGRNPGRLASVELEALKTLHKRLSADYGSDMMRTEQGLGRPVIDMGEAGFTAENMERRGQRALAVARAQNIPIGAATPLMESEVAALGDFLDNPDTRASQRMAVARTLVELGPDMMRAALRQLNQTNPVFSYVAGFLGAGRSPEVATRIFEGTRILKENKQPFGTTETAENLSADFGDEVGFALSGVRNTKNIFQAALAHYAAERARGGGDTASFEDSIAAVLGAGIETLNGRKTLIPRGLTAENFDTFLENVQPETMAELGREGLPPLNRNTGRPFEGDELSGAQLQAIGDGLYRILVDGRPVATDEAGANAYVMQVDPEVILDPFVNDPLREALDPGAVAAAGELTRPREAFGEEESGPTVPGRDSRDIRRDFEGGGPIVALGGDIRPSAAEDSGSLPEVDRLGKTNKPPDWFDLPAWDVLSTRLRDEFVQRYNEQTTEAGRRRVATEVKVQGAQMRRRLGLE